MSFRSIDNPFHNTHLVKIKQVDSDVKQFRPSSIDEVYSDACVKAEMELLEDSIFISANIISTAAHEDRSMAIYNAQKEAVERISLSAWWAFRRSIQFKLDQKSTLAITERYLPFDDTFSASIGFVQSACGTGYVAVSILENSQSYPRAVLGGSYDIDYQKAASKAFLESLQSWAATDWLKTNNIDQMPYWDTEELLKRVELIGEATDISDISEYDSTVFSNYFLDKEITTEQLGRHFVAAVGVGVDIYGYTHRIAELDARPGESVEVFTQHNF